MVEIEMTVYVDDVAIKFRMMYMCHMWADTLDELYAMVDRIGVQRKWFQCPPKASWEHFDISTAKKRLALQYGAVLTDKYGPLCHVARLGIISGDQELFEYGINKIALIERLRNG